MRKAAVVGGAAYAGKKAGERKSAEKEAEAQQAAEQQAPATGGGTDDTVEQLKQLAELRDSGVLTDEEFEAQKQKILGS